MPARHPACGKTQICALPNGWAVLAYVFARDRGRRMKHAPRNKVRELFASPPTGDLVWEVGPSPSPHPPKATRLVLIS
jgi:hypothetical protein